MGLSFCNLQIENRDRLTPEQVKEVLIQYYGKQGLAVIEGVGGTHECGNRSHRVVSFIISPDERWIGVYDEAFEYDGELAYAAALALAPQIGDCCFSFSTDDSDTALLRN